jgi:hypothetical protein
MSSVSGAEIDRMLWVRYRPPRETLRVGITLDSWIVPDWIYRAIIILQSTPGLALVSISCLDKTPRQPTGKPAWIFRLLENRSRRVADPDCPLHDLCAELRDIHKQTIEIREADSSVTAVRSAIAPLALDFLIRFDSATLEGDAAGIVAKEVWSIQPGIAARNSGCPPFWPEVRDNVPITRVQIYQYPERLERPHPLYSYTGPTRQDCYYTRNAVEPLHMAAWTVADRLLAAASGCQPAPRPTEPTVVATNPPTTGETLRFIARQARRSIKYGLPRATKAKRWFMALRRKSGKSISSMLAFDPSGFADVPLPSGYSRADPFLFEWQGRDYILFEEIPPETRRGRLAIAEIRASGEIGPSQVILERSWHLSWPCIFSHGGDIFLLPESCENRTVQLFRASGGSPFSWRLERTLLEGARLVDTTPFYYQNVWYFFTTQIDSGTRVLLFYAYTLDGEWKWHPSNPVCTDISRARSAGALFFSGGKLIRPAQDCSIRYGYGIVLNEIQALSPTEFQESPLVRLKPSQWRPGILAMHTVNTNARWEAIDGYCFMHDFLFRHWGRPAHGK